MHAHMILCHCGPWNQQMKHHAKPKPHVHCIRPAPCRRAGSARIQRARALDQRTDDPTQLWPPFLDLQASGSFCLQFADQLLETDCFPRRCDMRASELVCNLPDCVAQFLDRSCFVRTKNSVGLLLDAACTTLHRSKSTRRQREARFVASPLAPA